MNSIVSLIVTVICSVLASSGLWAFISKLADKKDCRTRLLVGLGHDRIISLCEKYIDRGWITSDEYENLNDYLYLPYKAAGGNGSAERAMKQVMKLPIRKNNLD